MNKLKTLLGIILLTFGVSATASENPVPIGQNEYGWIFLMPDQTQRLCGRSQEDHSKVLCLDSVGVLYECSFHEPPKYFSSCAPKTTVQEGLQPANHVLKQEYSIKYMEPALRFSITNGPVKGRVICTENKSKESRNLPEGWVALSCRQEMKKAYQLCYINMDKQSIMCGVKPS